MILNEREIRQNTVLEAARQIMLAARTAPKGKGIDIIEIATVTDEKIIELSHEMLRISEETGLKFLIRDADNILKAEAIVLLGTAQKTLGLNCSYCGYVTCLAKPEAVPCAINTIDLGIAIGSACAKAADLRVDSRVMFSVGLAAERLGYLGEKSKCIIGIPLSASSKNPFFDRQTKTPPVQS